MLNKLYLFNIINIIMLSAFFMSKLCSIFAAAM